jgi:hypothetical protein
MSNLDDHPMKLRTGLIFFSNLLSTLGIYSLIVSGIFSPFIGLALVIGLFCICYLEMRDILPIQPMIKGINSKWLVLMIPSVYFLLSVPLIDLVTWFLVFIMYSRMIFKSELNDYLFGYLIAIVCILLGALFTKSISFAIIFFGFYLVLCWSLIFYNMMVERAGSHSPPDLFKTIGNNETAGTALFGLSASLILLSMVLTAAIFITFPRLGLNFFKINSASSPVSGFTETVTIGDVGKIKENDTVVMRVEYQRNNKSFRPTEKILWRGVVLNHYDGYRWSSTVGNTWTARNHQGAGTYVMSPGAIESLVTQHIFMEPFESNVIFTHGIPLFVDGNFHKIMLDQNYVLRTGSSWNGAKNFIFESDIGDSRKSFKMSLPEPDVDVFPKQFLQLPPLSRKFTNLALELTRNHSTPLAKANQVYQYLHDEFGYTLDMETSQKETALDHFLFTRKEGHCEYFATAMAVLLRVVGVPTRIVNGFTGEEWNDLGNYLIVRQKHAHSWVEVHLPGKGWVVFDPTPTDPSLSSQAEPSAFSRSLDMMRLNWQRYVVRYSVGDQIQILMSFQSHGESFVNKIKTLETIDWEDANKTFQDKQAYILLALMFFMLILVLFRNHPSSFGWLFFRIGSNHFAAHLYKEMLHRLGKMGIRKPAHFTHREFLGKLSSLPPEKQQAAQQVTQFYEDTRFAQTPFNREKERYIWKLVKKI